MELDADTLERLVPEQLDPSDIAGLESLQLHLDRYEFATRHARPGRLLDMACGVGYGTRLLADRCSGLHHVQGVDLSSQAVAHARRHYGGEGVGFEAGDAMQFRAPEPFDTIVSLETVEHMPDPVGFFAHLVGLLAADGVLVASVPTTPSVDLNPHHLHDFTATGFRRMGAAHGLVEIGELPQIQRVKLRELLRGGRFRRENLRSNLPAYYLRHPGALAKRAGATLRFGLSNHYLTLAWQRPPS